MIVDTFKQWAQRTALESDSASCTYAELIEAVAQRAQWLEDNGMTRLALEMDNSIEWVVTDLACMTANVCVIPVPDFFTDAQKQHLLRESQAQYLFTDQTQSEPLLVTTFNHSTLVYQLERSGNVVMPDNTGKITFTSGSTGNPKGVCLSHHSQVLVAQALTNALDLPSPRHLCLLPLPTLLENIAGVYAPLLAGGCVYLANHNSRGFAGSKLINPSAMLSLISRVRPQTLIVTPALLQLMIVGCQQGWQPPASLVFVAVGGAKVAPRLLANATAAGLPVYEGYGLSEAVSVSTLNTPENCRTGTVGKPLGHNRIDTKHGEIIVSGNLFLGYLNVPSSFYPTSFNTGDLGKISDGYLTIEGRKKHLIINAFGRNISPEWVESELMASGLLRQVVVAGDAQTSLIALAVLATPSITPRDVEHMRQHINSQLPDYAHISHILSVSPFTPENGQATTNGKVKREAVLSAYQQQIEHYFEQTAQV